MNRGKAKVNSRRQTLQETLKPAERGGCTIHAAQRMATGLDGATVNCTITGHCRTMVFEFPGGHLASSGRTGPLTVYSDSGFRAAIVSELVDYFEQEPGDSLHYSIDVSLRAGVRRAHNRVVGQLSRNRDTLFIVIEDNTPVTPTELNHGECFTIPERLDDEAIVEGGREGETALLAVRTVDGSWPDFDDDTDRVNAILSAVKMEQYATDHIEEVYRCSCYMSQEGRAVYVLNPKLGAAIARVGQSVDALQLEGKALGIQSMAEAMIEDRSPVAAELFDAMLLDKTRDDGYLRLRYLRLWQALEDAKKHLGIPDLLNCQEVIAGERTPKELKEYRNAIAHWETGRIDLSYLSDLQQTAIELLRRKYRSEDC